jgi:hypothetical protein
VTRGRFGEELEVSVGGLGAAAAGLRAAGLRAGGLRGADRVGMPVGGSAFARVPREPLRAPAAFRAPAALRVARAFGAEAFLVAVVAAGFRGTSGQWSGVPR